MDDKKRCKWVDLKNPLYVKYHDNEWGRPIHDDRKLFEQLILEIFQSGLSFEIVLKKRENFRLAFDNFDYLKIMNYDDVKVLELLNNPYIIRNKAKILATINNAKAFNELILKYKTFDNYIWKFTNYKTIYECDKTKSPLSDEIAKDLKNNGFKFIGSTTIYSYLQAIGIINAHDKDCFAYKINNQ